MAAGDRRRGRRCLARLGLRTGEDLAGVAAGIGSLADAGARGAFVHTARAAIDARGQRVSATDRLYLAADLPTLIVWGERDPIIPVAHGRDAHAAIPGQPARGLRGRRPLPAPRGARPLRRGPRGLRAQTEPAALAESDWSARLRAGA